MQTEFLKKFINELADMSGDYISKEFGKKHSVDSKKDESPVTVVDRNVELMIRERIKKQFPDHGIIGEEFGNENESSEYQWVIDPIDGTKSFITGVPLFGTLIGLMHKGDPILGVIDQPILKERCVGDNKSCMFNGKAVFADKNHGTLKGAIALTSDTRDPTRKHSEKGWRNFEKSVFVLRSWGDCYGYMLLCRGFAHIMLDASLQTWDLVALIPCLRGAGAVYSDWNRLNKFGEDGLISCCSQNLYNETLKVLNDEV